MNEVIMPSMKEIAQAEKRLREIAKTLGARITKSKARNSETKGYGSYQISVLNPEDGYGSVLESYTVDNLDQLEEHLVSAHQHYELEERQRGELHSLWYKYYCWAYFEGDSDPGKVRINDLITYNESDLGKAEYHEARHHYSNKLYELQPGKDHGSQPYRWADIEYAIKKLHKNRTFTKEKLASMYDISVDTVDKVLAGETILTDKQLQRAKEIGGKMAEEEVSDSGG